MHFLHFLRVHFYLEGLVAEVSALVTCVNRLIEASPETSQRSGYREEGDLSATLTA